MEEVRTDPVKWLKYLMYVGIGHVAAGILANFPALSGVLRWVTIGLSAATVFLALKLSNANARYRNVVGFGAAALVFDLLGIELLATVGSICGIVAEYQEYRAHSELAAQRDEKLSGKWMGLFWLQFVMGIIVAAGSLVGVIIALSAGLDEAQILAVLTPALTVVLLIPAVLYPLYLHRTIRALETEVSA